MAILDLLNLQPTTVSRDLRNKYILLYGLPKVGKTSFAAQCPNNLIFCFEKGVNFLSGVYAVDVPKWTDFKALLQQLDRPELKEKYHTVTIDTLSIAWDLCIQYICTQNDVKTISDIAWGRGYALAKEEFSSALRKISMMGYGIILLTHAKTKVESVGDDKTIEIVSPNVPERAQDVVNALVDIIGYIKQDFIGVSDNGDPISIRTLYTRATPTIVAGSRLKYLENKIPFGYNELVNAVGSAIEKQANDGDVVVDKRIAQEVIEKRPFAETIAEARTLWDQLLAKDTGNIEKISSLTESIFGSPIRLSEIPEEKQDMFELLINLMKEL